jgi:hypothetical protein
VICFGLGSGHDAKTHSLLIFGYFEQHSIFFSRN